MNSKQIIEGGLFDEVFGSPKIFGDTSSQEHYKKIWNKILEDFVYSGKKDFKSDFSVVNEPHSKARGSFNLFSGKTALNVAHPSSTDDMLYALIHEAGHRKDLERIKRTNFFKSLTPKEQAVFLRTMGTDLRSVAAAETRNFRLHLPFWKRTKKGAKLPSGMKTLADRAAYLGNKEIVSPAEWASSYKHVGSREQARQAIKEAREAFAGLSTAQKTKHGIKTANDLKGMNEIFPYKNFKRVASKLGVLGLLFALGIPIFVGMSQGERS